jgi:hypothetical protein
MTSGGNPMNGQLGGQIAIIGVIFCQNLSICPLGVPIYRAGPIFYAIDIEDQSRFNLEMNFCG